MKRISLSIVMFLACSINVLGQMSDLMSYPSRDGWKRECSSSDYHFTKTMIPNFPENNCGRKVKKDALGVDCIQMNVNVSDKRATCYDYSVSGIGRSGVGECKVLPVTWKNGITFKACLSRNDEAKDLDIKKDHLGRVVYYHQYGRGSCYGYEDIADGTYYTLEYYGNSHLVKRMTMKGWGNYPKDKALREKLYPFMKNGGAAYDAVFEYTYDNVNHIMRCYTKSSATEFPRAGSVEELKTGNGFNDKVKVVEYDCNGNPYRILVNTRKGVKEAYLFYVYE